MWAGVRMVGRAWLCWASWWCGVWVALAPARLLGTVAVPVQAGLLIDVRSRLRLFSRHYFFFALLSIYASMTADLLNTLSLHTLLIPYQRYQRYMHALPSTYISVPHPSRRT